MLHGRMLRYLDEVVKCGSIRKAASRLNVSASAISRQILSLEKDIEAPIFERMPNGLRLTATGEILIGHVRTTIQEHQRARAQMAALKGLIRGEATIATMGGLAGSLLSEVVRDFRVAYPGVRLIVRVLSGEAIVQSVLSGDAHIGLAYGLPHHPRLYRAIEFDHPIGVVVARDHPFAIRRSVRFVDCLPHPLVMMERGMSLREAVEALVPVNAWCAPAVETNSLEMIKRLARTSPNVAFLNFIEVEEELRSGELIFVPLVGRNARQNIALVHRASGPLDPVTSVVANFVSDAAKAKAAAFLSSHGPQPSNG